MIRENCNPNACESANNGQLPYTKPYQVLSIYDLDTNEATHACGRMRKNAKKSQVERTVGMIGGRLSYLNRVRNVSGTPSASMLMPSRSLARAIWMQWRSIFSLSRRRGY